MFSITMFYPAPKRGDNNVFSFLTFNFVQPTGNTNLYMLANQHIVVPDHIAQEVNASRLYRKNLIIRFYRKVQTPLYNRPDFFQYNM